MERQTLGPGTGLALGKRPREAHRAAASKGFTDFAPVCDIGVAMPITDEETEAWRGWFINGKNRTQTGCSGSRLILLPLLKVLPLETSFPLTSTLKLELVFLGGAVDFL